MCHNQSDSDSDSWATDTAKADTRRYSQNSVNVYSIYNT